MCVVCEEHIQGLERCVFMRGYVSQGLIYGCGG
jgi:hypothetical protein